MKNVIIWLIHILDHIVPKQDKILLRGYPDIEDQCLSVLMALARRRYPGKVIWLIRDEVPDPEQLIRRYDLTRLRVELCDKSTPAALWHFLTARFVLFTHGTYSQGDWGNYPPPRRKTVVNMWHGMPIKSIWGYLPDPIEPPHAHLLLATSPRFQQIMAKASGMDEQAVRVLGLPRNDLLLQQGTHAREAIRELVGDAPWFLYLPTYRKSKEGYVAEDGHEHDSVLSMSEADTRTLDAWLQSHQTKLVVKAHPMSIHAGLTCEQKTDHIVVISEDWLVQRQLTLYGLTGGSDGLITDLSSIAVDYLLMDKPVFIYFPDRAAYVEGRGTVFDDLEKNLPGTVCANVEAMLTQMDLHRAGQDPAVDQRARLLAEWHAFPTGSAADRLLDELGL